MIRACEVVASGQSTGQCGHCSSTEVFGSSVCNAAVMGLSCYFQVVDVQKLYTEICRDSKLIFMNCKVCSLLQQIHVLGLI